MTRSSIEMGMLIPGDLCVRALRIRRQFRRELALLLFIVLLTTSPHAWASPGDPDPDFNGGNRVYLAQGYFINAPFALQSTGKILVGTGKYDGSGYINRLTPTGALDSSFAGGGTLSGYTLRAVLPDDRLIVSDSSGLARLGPDGDFDPSFGTAGHAALQIVFS